MSSKEYTGIWITWEIQRRNKGISSALDFPLYELEVDAPQAIRYLVSVYKTVRIIVKDKPQLLVVQNPSIVLAFSSILFRLFFHYKLVVDAHNSGILPAEGKSPLLMRIARWLQRKADLTIVTNTELKKIVDCNGGKGFVLPDKIPTCPEKVETDLNGKLNIAFICTFSEDEPYMEVIKAASMLDNDIIFYITGRYTGKISRHDVSPNVKLLGFVSDEEYWTLLQSADIVMDLTLREGCLVCGAYEALAANKPMILSNTLVLKEYFSKGCIYVEPDAYSIVSGVHGAVRKINELKCEIKLLKADLQQSWDERLKILNKKFDTLLKYGGLEDS